MKRKLGRLLARVQNVVKRVWRRLFPETTEEAQLPASKPRTIRGFDSVTDAEYEDVTVLTAQPPAEETPVLEWMSATPGTENRAARATELAAELESFLKSTEPTPEVSALAESLPLVAETVSQASMESRASAAAEYSADVDAALATAFEAGAFEDSLGVEPEAAPSEAEVAAPVATAPEAPKVEESAPLPHQDEPEVAEVRAGAELESMAAHIPPEPEELPADPIWAAPEVVPSLEASDAPAADDVPAAEIEAVQAVLEGAAVEAIEAAADDAEPTVLAETIDGPAEEIVALHVETEGVAVEERVAARLDGDAADAELRIDAELAPSDDETPAVEAQAAELSDEPAEELVVTPAEAAADEPAEEVVILHAETEEAAVQEPAAEHVDGDIIRIDAEFSPSDDETLAVEAQVAEPSDEPAEEVVSLHAETEDAAVEAPAIETAATEPDDAPDAVASETPDDVAYQEPWSDFAAPALAYYDAATTASEPETPPAAEAAVEGAGNADVAAEVAADDGVEAAAAVDEAALEDEAAQVAEAGDEEPGASAEAMAAAPVAEPHHEKTWDEAALAELTADVSEATPVEEIAAAAEVDIVDELTATLETGIDAEAALADAMAAVSEEAEAAQAAGAVEVAAEDIAVAAELSPIDIAEAAEEMVSAEAVASQAEHAAETARAAAQAEVEAAADVAPVPVAGTIRVPMPPIQIPSDYVPAAESSHAIYQLSLDGFEGPLDLLLHLIKRHHVDIFDIPIAFICEQYLKYIKMMEDLDIDVAAEFLFMASELLHLKSRMLLPKPEGETVEEDEVDPRAELVRRLLEYQKYKDAAEKFSTFDRFNRDVFGRDAEDPPPALGEPPLKEVGLFALVKAFESVLKRQKPEVRHQVMMEQVSVRARIRVLLTQIENTMSEGLRFEDLLADAHRRIDIVVTFLALLEMGKLKLLRIFQAEDGVIYLHPKFDDVTAAFARLEGIDESQYA